MTLTYIEILAAALEDQWKITCLQREVEKLQRELEEKNAYLKWYRENR